MSEHTKTPWDYYVATMGGDDSAVIHPQGEPDDYRICTVFDEAGKGTSPEANARHIVHCVNSHERLVAQLEEAKEFMEVELTGTAWADCRHMAHSIGNLLAQLQAGKGGE